jgi:hypothetical protein
MKIIFFIILMFFVTILAHPFVNAQLLNSTIAKIIDEKYTSIIQTSPYYL